MAYDNLMPLIIGCSIGGLAMLTCVLGIILTECHGMCFRLHYDEEEVPLILYDVNKGF